jgi:cellulose 1,4-beta-cellobiosidase
MSARSTRRTVLVRALTVAAAGVGLGAIGLSPAGISPTGIGAADSAQARPAPEPGWSADQPAPPPAARVGNPYLGAKGYLNPDYAAKVRAAAKATGGGLGRSMAKVAGYPTAVWLDRIATIAGGKGVKRTLRGHLDAALAQQGSSATPVVVTLVVYDLPNRDCAALASNGELTVAGGGLARYRTSYVDPIAKILADKKYARLRLVTVVEPDSLPNLVTNLSIPKCAEAQSSGAYAKGVQHALDKLHAIPNVYTYLDVAHSGWLGWDNNFEPSVKLITETIKGTSAGVASVDGFVTNTANYTPLAEDFMPDGNASVGGQPLRSAKFYEYNPRFAEGAFATAMRASFVRAGMPSTIGMLVDTSRNGWGGKGRPGSASRSKVLNTFVNESRIDRRLHRGNWCNQPGGIGRRPAAAPAAGLDAYVWVKPPGESDGTSDKTQTEPDDEGKSFDAMCDPTGSSRADPAFKTGAMPDAPSAGTFFVKGFKVLVGNAYPGL